MTTMQTTLNTITTETTATTNPIASLRKITDITKITTTMKMREGPKGGVLSRIEHLKVTKTVLSKEEKNQNLKTIASIMKISKNGLVTATTTTTIEMKE